MFYYQEIDTVAKKGAKVQIVMLYQTHTHTFTRYLTGHSIDIYCFHTELVIKY